jgi:hypothetical protein
MGLQAYVDDSGNEPQSAFFVLGGFIAWSDQWGLFADEWKAALHRGNDRTPLGNGRSVIGPDRHLGFYRRVR